MLALGIVNAIGLIAIAALVAGATVLWGRLRDRPFFLPVASRSRIWPVRLRIAFAAGALLILLATTWATWRTVRDDYALIADEPAPSISVPTRPAPALPDLPDGADVPQARLLAQLVLVDSRYYGPGVPLRPIHVEQLEIHWPQERRVSRLFHALDAEWEFVTDIHRAFVGQEGAGSADPPAGPGPLLLTGTATLSRNGDLSNRPVQVAHGSLRSAAGQLLALGVHGGRLERPLRLLSVTPGLPVVVTAMVFVTHVADRDPLQSVPAGPFLAEREAELDEPLPRRQWHLHEKLLDVRRDRANFGAFALAYMGLPSVLLPVAAALLAQLFRRKDLALAGMLLVMVLYVAAIDRIVLSSDLDRLRDNSQPVSVRMTAADRADATFFYWPTARSALRSVGEDSQTPAPLRGVLTGQS